MLAQLRRLLPYLRRYRTSYAVGALCVLVSVALRFLVPYLLGDSIDALRNADTADPARLRRLIAVAHDQHHCVVEAIAAREGARAEAIMQEHARLAGRNLRLALSSEQTQDLVPGHALIRPGRHGRSD